MLLLLLSNLGLGGSPVGGGGGGPRPLTAADVQLTIVNRDGYHVPGYETLIRGQLTFGDGFLRYPPGGVPLPEIGQFGFRVLCRTLQVIAVAGAPADYVTRYNPGLHALQLFEDGAPVAGGPLEECDSTVQPTARTYLFHAEGH